MANLEEVEASMREMEKSAKLLIEAVKHRLKDEEVFEAWLVEKLVNTVEWQQTMIKFQHDKLILLAKKIESSGEVRPSGFKYN